MLSELDIDKKDINLAIDFTAQNVLKRHLNSNIREEVYATLVIKHIEIKSYIKTGCREMDGIQKEFH